MYQQPAHPIRAHHRRAIEAIIARVQEDKRYRALIAGGSVANGLAGDESDIDIVLVAEAAEFARVQATHAYHYFTREGCDYPNGYVCDKIVDCAFLGDVAVRRAPDKPERFVEAANAPCRHPGGAQAQAVVDCQGAVVRFMEDAEWNWRSGRPPLHDW